jgi:hypothetical protein
MVVKREHFGRVNMKIILEEIADNKTSQAQNVLQKIHHGNGHGVWHHVTFTTQGHNSIT